MHNFYYEKIDDLPKSWQLCKFGEIVNILRGASPRPIKEHLTTEAGGIPWIKIGDAKPGEIYINQTEQKIKKESAKKSVFLTKGSLILSNSMSFGRPYILNIDGCIHDGWLAIEIYNKTIDIEFLQYILQGYMWFFKSTAGGSSVDNLNIDKVKEMPFALPPYNEQKRIIASLRNIDAYINKIKKSKEEISKISAILKTRILEMFFGENSSYKSYYKNGSLIDDIEIYDNLRKPISLHEREKRIEKAQTLYPYFGATGQTGVIDDFILEGEYVLLGEDGAPFLDKTADKAYLVQGKIWVNNHAHVLKSRTNNKFLMYYLNWFDYFDYVSGTTRLKLNQAMMKKIPFPIVSGDIKEEIVDKIEKAFAILDVIN